MEEKRDKGRGESCELSAAGIQSGRKSKAEAWFCLSPGPETLRFVIVIAKKCSYMTAELHFF